MIKRIATTFIAALLISFATLSSAQAATLSQTLSSQLNQLGDSASVGFVIVSFNTSNGLSAAHLNILRGIGINKGITFQKLGMVGVPATAGQVRALASNSAVRSVWSNDKLEYYMHQARVVAGVDRVLSDGAFTFRNGGLPVSGKGDFSVMVIDSGVDATHNDLRFGEKVVQNVQVLTSTDLVAEGFTPLVTAENVPNTDQTVGHGTHCAGIIGGTGQNSGGLYRGVAPGAKIIGAGLGAGLFVLNAVGAWEWALVHQFDYNIRVISNSYGSGGPFEPDNPIHVASRKAYERNITVVFAAGNSGPGKGTYNQYAKAPWVIGVAAGTKEGGLASFSSRGLPREERLGNEDTSDDYDTPTITAPGTGREFETNAAKFTSDIVSVRAISNLTANGTTADADLPVAHIPFYTQISGTSMATPFVAGTVALMLDADPTLTPDQIRSILTETASRMPGYEDFEVGAGYLNAYAAVDKVFNRSKNYGTFREPTFNARYSVSGPAAEPFHIDYSPAALPGPGSTNSVTFTVAEGMSVLDVFTTFDNAIETGDGNTIGILLTAPDGTKYSSGIALPILDGNTRQVIVKNPQPGEWLLEARGVRGLAALPNVSLPTSGAALPGPVNGTIQQKLFTLETVADIQGHAAQAQIENALKNRQMDTFSDGTFRPEDAVTRADFARLLVLNTPVRQSLGSTARFTDVSAELAPIAEAVAANGSTTRDYNFTPKGLMSVSGNQFNPDARASRVDIAVALIRALGLDAEAKAKAGQPVTVTYSGQTLVLADNADIPTALRGYVQFALDRGILQASYTLEQGPFDLQPTLKARVNPNNPMSRAFMAYALDSFRRNFVAGT
jgi:Subtilisin-like serine proteases